MQTVQSFHELSNGADEIENGMEPYLISMVAPASSMRA